MTTSWRKSRPYHGILWVLGYQACTMLRDEPLLRHTAAMSCVRRTTMEIPRPAPPRSAPERVMLEAWLDFHRITLERKCSGLSPEQLRRRAVPPSSLSLLGLVRHMADVERGWFRGALANEDAPPHYRSDTD